MKIYGVILFIFLVSLVSASPFEFINATTGDFCLNENNNVTFYAFNDEGNKIKLDSFEVQSSTNISGFLSKHVLMNQTVLYISEFIEPENKITLNYSGTFGSIYHKNSTTYKIKDCSKMNLFDEFTDFLDTTFVDGWKQKFMAIIAILIVIVLILIFKDIRGGK